MPSQQCPRCEGLTSYGLFYTDEGRACTTCIAGRSICDNCGNYIMGATCLACGGSPSTAVPQEVPTPPRRIPRWMGEPHPALNNIVRKLGIELEFIPPSEDMEEGFHSIRDFGEIKGDGSVSDEDVGDGLEFASEPLAGSKFVNMVHKVTSTLKSAGCFVNSTCGFHLHIDMSETDEDQRKNVQNWWRIYEPIFFGLVRNNRRDNMYCHWVENKSERNWRGDRYHSLNIAAYHSHSTYELRLHHGTLEADEILPFSATALTFFDWAQNIAPSDEELAKIKAATSRKYTGLFLKSIKTPYSINKSIIKKLRRHRTALLRDGHEEI